jgi:ribosome biogenesis GTPase
VFCGHSGVGKSSLLTALLGHELRKAGEVSSVTGKGKHTTSSALLIPHEGSEWIDTPGVREFGLIGINPGDLRNYYVEFLNVACSERGCLHREEEDCEARSLPRYLSYRRILESLIEG